MINESTEIELENFPEEFHEVVQDGLSSSKSYVILAQSEDAKIHLALRPLAQRITPEAVGVIGKLRCAYNYTGRGEVQSEVNDSSAIKALQEFAGKFTFDTKDGRRLSTLIGYAIVAGHGDFDALKKEWDEFDIVNRLLDDIAELSGHPMTGVTDVPETRSKIRNALNYMFTKQLSEAFYVNGGTVPKNKLGKTSSFLIRTKHDLVNSALELL